MNKRFSTLVAAFAAIATVSYAQIGDKYVHLKTSSNLPDGYKGESGKSRLCKTCISWLKQSCKRLCFVVAEVC